MLKGKVKPSAYLNARANGWMLCATPRPPRVNIHAFAIAETQKPPEGGSFSDTYPLRGIACNYLADSAIFHANGFIAGFSTRCQLFRKNIYKSSCGLSVRAMSAKTIPLRASSSCTSHCAPQISGTTLCSGVSPVPLHAGQSTDVSRCGVFGITGCPSPSHSSHRMCIHHIRVRQTVSRALASESFTPRLALISRCV